MTIHGQHGESIAATLPSATVDPAVTCHGIDVLDGVTIEQVSVPDISAEERYRTTREETQREVAAIDLVLRSHPEWKAPAVAKTGDRMVFQPNNPVAEWLYERRPALRFWRTHLVPSALALTSLYYPESWTLPTGEQIDRGTWDYFMHTPDAIGIRRRAAVMSAIAARYLSPDTKTRWTSLACGAAIPVFQALAGQRSGAIDVKLVDLDPAALSHAAQLAAGNGFREGVDVHLLQRHLIRELIATSSLVDELGASSQDFVDMLGIFEYIPEKFGDMNSAAVFLRNAFQLVKPGGAVVAANMLDIHPALHFNQRGIGWPKIFPRSTTQLLRIIADAGIRPEWVTMTIPDDGVYAIVEIRKPHR